MSAKFLGGTELFMYECMMQQTPNLTRYGKEEKKLKARYIGSLKEFMRNNGYGAVIKRVMNSLDKFLFDEFVFLSDEHKELFWRMYLRMLKTGTKNIFNRTAVIYLLSTHREFEIILANYVSNPLYALPCVYKGNGTEEKYSIYHAAKMLAGADTKLTEEDLLEDGIVSDTVLCLIINAKFIAKYGINGCKERKPKQRYVNNSMKHRRNKNVYTYNGQTIRIK